MIKAVLNGVGIGTAVEEPLEVSDPDYQALRGEEHDRTGYFLLRTFLMSHFRAGRIPISGMTIVSGRLSVDEGRA